MGLLVLGSSLSLLFGMQTEHVPDLFVPPKLLVVIGGLALLMIHPLPLDYNSISNVTGAGIM